MVEGGAYGDAERSLTVVAAVAVLTAQCDGRVSVDGVVAANHGFQSFQVNDPIDLRRRRPVLVGITCSSPRLIHRRQALDGVVDESHL